MPPKVLQAFVEDMPRLQAQEALRQYTIAAVASGNMKAAQARRILGGWRRQAQLHSGIKKAKSREEHMALLASVGIRVR